MLDNLDESTIHRFEYLNDGFINIYKPIGITSHDVVARVRYRLRNITNNKKIKVGHLGTLDPAAEGVLVITFGNATKYFDIFLEKRKRYIAEFTFGIETDTLDREGKITKKSEKIPNEIEVREKVKDLIGEIMQVPPQYSAKSVNGKKAYELARRGESFELKPKKVKINDIQVLKMVNNKVVLSIDCLGGAYIRSLARDLANMCGTVGYMSALKRVVAGVFKSLDAIDFNLFMKMKNEEIINPSNHVLLPKEFALKKPETLTLESKSDKKLIVVLGYLDCIHLGHAKLIAQAKIEAERLNGEIQFEENVIDREGVKVAVFTFFNNPFLILKKNILPIYDFETRLSIIDTEYVISSEFDENIMKMSGTEFLDKLLKVGDIKAVVVGKDYRFALNAECDVEFLKFYLKSKQIEVIVVDTVLAKNGEKISSSTIRQCLKEGNIEKVNELLTKNYEINGVVTRGSQIGTKIGFKTANIFPKEDILCIKEGVYKTVTYIKEKKYNSITNVGSRPTVDSEKVCKIETHIDGINRDLYGEFLKIEFIKRIRDVKKFDKLEDLIDQLNIDKMVK